jgi:opacity protein-like surface antigen
MRSRYFVLAAVLLLPALASGQIRVRRPPVGGAAPRPAPKPPQAPGIHDARLYHRVRLSVESYSLVNFVHTDRYVTDDGAQTSSLFGFGTRLDWRFKPAFSATLDLTSSAFGGPYTLSTVELGTRYMPVRPGRGSRPFVDLRGSWAYNYDTYAQPYGLNTLAVPQYQYQDRSGRTTSRGFGGLVGAGIETGLTNTLFLTTGLSYSSYGMSSVTIANQPQGADSDYRTTALRFTVGIKYNGRRLTTPQ